MKEPGGMHQRAMHEGGRVRSLSSDRLSPLSDRHLLLQHVRLVFLLSSNRAARLAKPLVTRRVCPDSSTYHDNQS